MTRKKSDPVKKEPVSPVAELPLLEDLRRMIEETRKGVAATVNAALTLLYWRIGKRINEEILKGERAEYGEQIVSILSRLLITEYRSGFSAVSLFTALFQPLAAVTEHDPVHSQEVAISNLTAHVPYMYPTRTPQGPSKSWHYSTSLHQVKKHAQRVSDVAEVEAFLPWK